jgi:hypothetical protein
MGDHLAGRICRAFLGTLLQGIGIADRADGRGAEAFVAVVDVVFATESPNRPVDCRAAILIIDADVVRLWFGVAAVGALGWVATLVDDGAIWSYSYLCVVTFKTLSVEVRDGH